MAPSQGPIKDQDQFKTNFLTYFLDVQQKGALQNACNVSPTQFFTTYNLKAKLLNNFHGDFTKQLGSFPHMAKYGHPDITIVHV